MMPSESELSVVPGATHLFEEPGTLEQGAMLARDWFTDQLSRVGCYRKPVHSTKSHGTADIRAPTPLASRDVRPGPCAFVRHMNKY